MIKDSYRSAAAVLCQPVHFYRLILAGCVSGISFPGLPVRVVLFMLFVVCGLVFFFIASSMPFFVVDSPSPVFRSVSFCARRSFRAVPSLSFPSLRWSEAGLRSI